MPKVLTWIETKWRRKILISAAILANSFRVAHRVPKKRSKRRQWLFEFSASYVYSSFNLCITRSTGDVDGAWVQRIICWMGFCILHFMRSKEIKFQNPTTLQDCQLNERKNVSKVPSSHFHPISLRVCLYVAEQKKSNFYGNFRWRKRRWKRRRKQIKITHLINLCDQWPQVSEIIMSMAIKYVVEHLKYAITFKYLNQTILQEHEPLRKLIQFVC